MAIASYQVNKKDIIAVFLIFALALFARAAYLKDYRTTEAYPVLTYSDSYSYFLWGKDIAGMDVLGGSAFMKWPLYAYFVGFLFRIFGIHATMVYALQFVLGVINCILVYFIAKIIFNRRVALLAGLLCAWYALFVFYDGLLMYTSLSLFLNSLFFLLMLYIQRHPTKSSLFLAGILLGVCAITQGSIIIFGLLAVAWILWQNRQIFKGLFYGLLCFMAGLSIIIGAVTIRNYLVEKDIVLIAGNTGINFYLGNNPEANGLFHTPSFITPNQEDMFRDAKLIAKISAGRDLKTSEVSRFWFNKSLDFIKHNPRKYAALMLKKIGYLYSPREPMHDVEFEQVFDKAKIFRFMLTSLSLIMPFCLLGLFLNLKDFKKTSLLYFLLITQSLAIVLFFVTSRYRQVIVPFLIIFASSAVIYLWDTLRQKKYLRLGWFCVILLLLFLTFGRQAPGKGKFGYFEDKYLDFRYHLGKAMEYNDKADYQKALEEVEKAYQLQPNHYTLLSYGTIYYNMKDYKKAEEKFKEAIKVFPLTVDAYYDLGLLYNEEKRYAEAKELLITALSLNPEDIGAHFELGKAFKATGEKENARREFNFVLGKINRWRAEERAIITKELADLDK